MISLLPCPFCGSPASLSPGGGKMVAVACTNKNGCWAETRYFQRIDHAVKLWNHREPQRQRQSTARLLSP